jgi:hypothetical protein
LPSASGGGEHIDSPTHSGAVVAMFGETGAPAVAVGGALP